MMFILKHYLYFNLDFTVFLAYIYIYIYICFFTCYLQSLTWVPI